VFNMGCVCSMWIACVQRGLQCSMWIVCVVSVLLRQSIMVSGSVLFNVNCVCTVVLPFVLLHRSIIIFGQYCQHELHV